MKTEEEMDEMTDEQLLRYFNRRFKSKKLTDSEDYIYVARERPSKYRRDESVFRDPEFIDMYAKRGYRIIKCKVIELVQPGELTRDY